MLDINLTIHTYHIQLPGFCSKVSPLASTHNCTKFRMGSRQQDACMKMEDFIKIEKIGEGKK